MQQQGTPQRDNTKFCIFLPIIETLQQSSRMLPASMELSSVAKRSPLIKSAQISTESKATISKMVLLLHGASPNHEQRATQKSDVAARTAIACHSAAIKMDNPPRRDGKREVHERCKILVLRESADAGHGATNSDSVSPIPVVRPHTKILTMVQGRQNQSHYTGISAAPKGEHKRVSQKQCRACMLSASGCQSFQCSQIINANAPIRLYIIILSSSFPILFLRTLGLLTLQLSSYSNHRPIEIQRCGSPSSSNLPEQHTY